TQQARASYLTPLPLFALLLQPQQSRAKVTRITYRRIGKPLTPARPNNDDASDLLDLGVELAEPETGLVEQCAGIADVAAQLRHLAYAAAALVDLVAEPADLALELVETPFQMVTPVHQLSEDGLHSLGRGAAAAHKVRHPRFEPARS